MTRRHALRHAVGNAVCSASLAVLFSVIGWWPLFLAAVACALASGWYSINYLRNARR